MGHDDYDEDKDHGYGDEPPQASGGGGKIVMIIVIVVAVLGGLCAFMAIVAAIAIPNLIEARKSGNEAAAIGALKTISSAQTLFREGDADKDGTLNYGSLDGLSQVGYVDVVLGGGLKQGYEFHVEVSPTNPELEWWASASPAVPGTTGDRYFYTDQTGLILYSVDLPPAGPIDASKPLPPGVNPLGRR